MLTMASNLRNTLSSWFNCSRKRSATEMEATPDENTNPNVPGSPCRKKHRSALQANPKSFYSAKRRLDMSIATTKKVTNKRESRHKSDWLTDIATDTNHSMGWFMTLPLELLHMIFNQLNNDTLLLVSSLSKDLNGHVLMYLLSGQGLKHIIPYSSLLPSTRNFSFFNEAGKLFRKITVTQSLSRRLRIASQFSDKLKVTHECIHVDSGSAMAYKCFGRLFSQYISNWCEYDKMRAYCIIEKQAKLEQKLERILRFSTGVLPWQEYDFRQLVRSYLLEPSSSDKEYSFWLAQILKGHPITHQARLLYILTGPTDNAGFIYWSSTCDCSSSSHAKIPPLIGKERNLTEIARGLRVLLLFRKEWSMDSIISIFDELTTTPVGWCLGQVATLLMEAGTEVCQAIFGNRAVNGHANELSVMAYYLAHACVKDDSENGKSQKLRWYIELIKYTMAMLPNKKEKQWFGSQLIKHWQTYLTSLFEEEDFEDESEFEEIHQEFTVSLNCLTQLSILLMNTVALCAC